MFEGGKYFFGSRGSEKLGASKLIISKMTLVLTFDLYAREPASLRLNSKLHKLKLCNQPELLKREECN
jgi:hypothetical protein